MELWWFEILLLKGFRRWLPSTVPDSGTCQEKEEKGTECGQETDKELPALCTVCHDIESGHDSIRLALHPIHTSDLA